MNLNTIAINNRDELTRDNPERNNTLDIAEAGLNAIATDKIISSSVSTEKDMLRVRDLEFDLKKFRRIHVIGFGKASCEATLALEKVLGPKIKDGVVIDIKKNQCAYITSFVGTHPKPSIQNVEASKHIVNLAEEVKEDDLVLVVVSGGGSSLLCWPASECDRGISLYEKLVEVGGTIEELNTVRKHISLIKGGGLAKMLYPATVVSLIFCDIPGNYFEEVASGPTYKDTTTIDDVRTILKKYNFDEDELFETPKEDKYFENVHNVPLVSNVDALNAMMMKAQELGYKTHNMSAEIYESPNKTLEHFKKLAKPNCVVVGGGEVKLVVTITGGSGGRCAQVALEALPKLEEGDIFIAVASDGIDNSEAAGAIVDVTTRKKIEELGLDAADYAKRFDPNTLFKQTGNLLMTGPTGANISDVMFWLKK